MPDHKLFFQNKKKNLKIVNNSFTGYEAMLVNDKKDKKQKKKADESEASEVESDDAHKKKEKSFNLVIPRFDPSQLIVK